MDWSPPPKFELARPAILRVAEPWERQVNRDLITKGFPLSVRQDVIRALRKVVGEKPSIIRATERDLGLYLGLGGSFASLVASSGGASATPTLTYINTFSNTANQSSYTFSVDLGTYSDDLLIIVGVHTNTGPGLSSGTIQGQAATINVQTNNGGTGRSAAIMSAHPTAGGSQNIVINGSGSPVYGAIGVWRATGLTSVTPTATDDNAGGSGDRTVSVAISAAGFAIYVGTDDNVNPGAVSGTPTSRYNYGVEASQGVSGADHESAGGGTVSCTFGNHRAAVAAAFR